MENTITLRIISPEEMRSVIIFMKQFEKASSFVKVNIDYATKTYENLIRKGSMTVIVAELNNKLIGSFAFLIAPDLNEGKLTAIETYWYVEPEHRGIGIKLFNEFERIAINRGCKKLAMIHMMDSYPDRLEKLYKRRGYELIEKHYVKEL